MPVEPVRFVSCPLLLLTICGVLGLSAAHGAEGDREPVAVQQAQTQWPENPAHASLLAAADKSVADGAALVAHDRFRPAYHFLCASRFMNDPNGCVQFAGRYHMFFQHIPYMDVPNAPMRVGWGHAVSADLVHWEQWPIALMPGPGTSELNVVASGGCVIADGLPTIVYTGISPNGQVQSLARSFDGMRTWRRFAGNPVVPKPPALTGLEDGFRDPFVWREGEQWRMIVGSGLRGQGGTVLLYASADLLTWEFLGPLCTGMGADCFQWECPNFFRLGDDWVLVVSPLLHSLPSLRGPVQYAVGRYDGRRFEPGPWQTLDVGGPTAFYAPNSLEDDRGRRIQWGWLMGGGTPGLPWNGMLTLPRQLTLAPDRHLQIAPVAEVDTLRDAVLADIHAQQLKPGESLDVCRGTQFDAVLKVKKAKQGRIQLALFQSAAGDQATTVTLDLATGKLACGDKSGIAAFGAGDTVTLRVLVDRSVIEVYVDQRTVMSLRAYPAENDAGFRLDAADAPVEVSRIQVWRMKSIWPPIAAASPPIEPTPKPAVAR